MPSISLERACGAALLLLLLGLLSNACKDDGSDLPPPQAHRAAPVECDRVRSDVSYDPEPEYASCQRHEDCTQGDNGRCVGNGHDGWYCTYDECFSDGDCAGKVCGCEAGFRSDHNVCFREGNCLTDADCGSGYCSPSFGDCGNYEGVIGYFCHTAEDTCRDDSDCQGGVEGEGYCAYNKVAGRWACSQAHCVG